MWFRRSIPGNPVKFLVKRNDVDIVGQIRLVNRQKQIHFKSRFSVPIVILPVETSRHCLVFTRCKALLLAHNNIAEGERPVIFYRFVILFLVATMSFLGDAWAADVQVDEVERQPFDAGTMAVQGSAGMLAGAGVTVVGLTSLASTGASPEGTILITLVAIPGVAPIAVGFTGNRRGLGKNQLGTALGSLSGGLVGGALAVAAMKRETENMLTGITLSVLAAPVVGSIIGYHLEARHSQQSANSDALMAGVQSPLSPWMINWGTSF